MDQLLYTVDYYCDGELVASRHPSPFVPRKDDSVEFTDAEVRDQLYVVIDVHFMIPENAGELIDVSVTLEKM